MVKERGLPASCAENLFDGRGAAVWARLSSPGKIAAALEIELPAAFAAVHRRHRVASALEESPTVITAFGEDCVVRQGRCDRVAPAGFEPAISTLRGWHPWPLDDGALRWGAWIRTRTS